MILFELKGILGFVLLSVIVCLASKLLRKLYLIIPAVAALTLMLYMLIKKYCVVGGFSTVS